MSVPMKPVEYALAVSLSEELRIEACFHDNEATKARLLRMADVAEDLEAKADGR